MVVAEYTAQQPRTRVVQPQTKLATALSPGNCSVNAPLAGTAGSPAESPRVDSALS